MVGTQAWWELGKSVAKTVVLDRGRVAGRHATRCTTLTRGQRPAARSASPAFTAETALTMLRNVVGRRPRHRGRRLRVPEAPRQ